MDDILTKPFSQEKFVYFRDKHGLVNNSSLSEREHCCDINRGMSQNVGNNRSLTHTIYRWITRLWLKLLVTIGA